MPIPTALPGYNLDTLPPPKAATIPVCLCLGETFYNPMRVFPSKDRSELIFTLYQRPGMSDKDFKNDEEQIKGDLERLKGLVEKQSA